MAVVGSAEFQVRADRAQMKKDLEQAKRDVAGFTADAEREVGGSTGRIGGLLGKIGFAVAAVSAIIGTGIALAIKFGGASLQMAETIADGAKRIGIGTEALQEYQYVARKTGQDAAAVSSDLEAFSNKAAQAMAGLSKESADAFRALGFKPDDLKKFKDTEGLLDAVLDRIGELSSAADRAAITEKLGLGSLATAAREGSDEIAKLRDEARALGFVMDDALIQKGAAAQDQLEDLSQVIGIQMAEAFIGLSDEVLAFTGHIADAIRGLNTFIDRFKDVRARNDAMYGADFTKNVASGNSFQALRSAVGSVFSGRTTGAAQIIRSGGDLAVPGPIDQAALAAIAEAPRDPRVPTFSGRTSLTPVQPRGRTDNSAQRKAEQEARRAERVETEINRARAEMLGIVDNELQTVQQRYDTAKAQTEAEREAEKTQLESRKARKDITQGELDQLTLINRQTANLEDRVAADVLARDLSDERLAKERLLSDLTSDLLTLQASAARTAGERRQIERHLLAIAQQRAREDLLKDPTYLKLDADGQARAVASQDQVFKGQRDATNRNNMSPMDQWRDASLKSIGEVDEAYQAIAANGLDALNSGIVDAIMNSKSLGDVFSNVAKGILADLLAISVRRGITEPLEQVLFGGGNAVKDTASAVPSLVKTFLNSFGRRAAGGPVSAGSPYIVGENRAEIFVPSVPGTIMPNLGAMSGGAMSRQSAPMHFDLRGAVMTSDLLQQMQGMASTTGGAAFGAARKAVPSDMAKSSRYNRSRP